MQKTLFLLLLLISIQARAQQDDAPVVGVSDRRVDVYAGNFGIKTLPATTETNPMAVFLPPVIQLHLIVR